MTLIETAITMSLMGIVVGAVMMVTESTGKAVQTGATISDIGSRSNRALEAVGTRMSAASQANVFPSPQIPFSASQVDYQRGIDFVAGNIVWSNPERIILQYSPAEANDGVDNDGNGLVDECRLVCIENFGLPNQRTLVLCNRVSEFLGNELPNGLDDNGNGLIDERGFCMDYDGDRATIRLSLERLDSQGMRITQTIQQTISYRNR